MHLLQLLPFVLPALAGPAVSRSSTDVNALFNKRAVSFTNDGHLAGWDTFSIDKGTAGEVREHTDVFHTSSPSIKCAQTYDKDHAKTGRFHAEAVLNNGYKRGETGTYSFWFRLSEKWQFEPKQNYNIMQFIADFTDLGTDEDWMPTTMLWVVGNQLFTRVKHGGIPKAEQRTVPIKNLKDGSNVLGTVQAGQWHHVQFKSKWASDSSGRFEFWFDDVKVADYSGPTTVNHARTFSWRVGLYANGWHDDNGIMKGTQPQRQIWYDDYSAQVVAS